jgi:hypothetical protein
MSISSSVLPARSAAALVASIATALDKLLRICGVVPYALVVLGLHVITARVFFPSGQMKIAGPVIPMSLFNCDGDSRSSFRPRSGLPPSSCFRRNTLAHVYLFAILMVLMSVRPGAISLDALMR